MFEMTVFLQRYLMVVTFYMRSKLWPFKKQNLMLEQQMIILFMEVSVNNNEEELVSFKYHGAVEVKVIESISI
jgi:hypothetical protein